MSIHDDPYAGVEDLASFDGSAALDRYRAALLEKTWHQVDFIQRHVGADPLTVVELASGNGRLLMALQHRGLLAAGTGLERAASRVAFAQRWVGDLGLEAQVSTLEADVLTGLDDLLASSSADLVACITGAFGYFRPVDPGAPATLLGAMARVVRPGGHVLLELHLPGARTSRLLDAGDGHLRTWKALPESDPFCFYLSELEIVDEGRTLRHTKTFIGRDGSVDAGRIEELALHRRAEVELLLAEAGLEPVLVEGGWGGEDFADGASATAVVLARRPIP